MGACCSTTDGLHPSNSDDTSIYFIECRTVEGLSSTVLTHKAMIAEGQEDDMKGILFKFNT